MKLLCSEFVIFHLYMTTSDLLNNTVHYIKIKIYNFKYVCSKSVSKNNQLKIAIENPYQVHLSFLDLPMASTPI